MSMPQAIEREQMSWEPDGSRHRFNLFQFKALILKVHDRSANIPLKCSSTVTDICHLKCGRRTKLLNNSGSDRTTNIFGTKLRAVKCFHVFQSVQLPWVDLGACIGERWWEATALQLFEIAIPCLEDCCTSIHQQVLDLAAAKEENEVSPEP